MKKKHSFLEGPGGVYEILQVSLPIMISQGSLSLMLFTDRYILAGVGEAEPSASMTGGFLATLISVFFVGVLTYITPLAGQYLGAKEPKNSSVAFTQGLFLTGAIYPFLLIAGFFIAPQYMDSMGIPREEAHLAIDYFNVVNSGSIINLINVAISCFLSGIKLTGVVMMINVVGMILNAPLTSYCVHNLSLLSPVQGAGFATVTSSFIMMVFFIAILLWHPKMKPYCLSEAWSIDKKILKILVRYGSPTGGEFFLAFFAFSTFVSLFHSYGPHEALAMTITFNWDLVSYLPLWGLNIGMMSLVGIAMGAQDIKRAQRIAQSGALIAVGLSTIYTFVFWFGSDWMVRSMLPPNPNHDHGPVFVLAKSMVQMVSLYAWANSANMVCSAVLRAAGDTKICFLFTIIGDWMMLLSVWLAIKKFQLDPLYTWYIFVCFVGFISMLYLLRYRQGVWKSIQVIHSS
jgi:MATE family multidrug resistance protein